MRLVRAALNTGALNAGGQLKVLFVLGVVGQGQRRQLGEGGEGV
jgi:hypothetical protein